MPSRVFRLKVDRILEDTKSDDEEEEEKEIFDDFEFIEEEEVETLNKWLEEKNNPDNINKERQKMMNSESELLFSKDESQPKV